MNHNWRLLGFVSFLLLTAVLISGCWADAIPIPHPVSTYVFAQCPDDVDNFYIVGGRDAWDSSLDHLLRYEVSTQTWYRLAPLPVPAVVTITVLTLLGLVLAIGLVVDDAIVMLENIFRHIEEGMEPFDAAIKGAKEIGFAVMAMTLTLVAVFAPLAFAEGNTGKLFTESAMTVAAAVLVSGFVALTLTPKLASRILHHETRHNALFNFGEKVLVGLNNAYVRGLARVIRHPLMVVLVFALAAAAAFGLLKSLKSELAPTEDRGFFIGFMLAPEGSTLQYTDEYARQLEGIYQSVPEVNTAFVVVAPGLERPNPVNSALSFVMLKPWEERR